MQGIVRKSYLSYLFLWALMWGTLTFIFIAIVDPYGTSPIKIALNHINTYKPMRLDIDRIIKPLEVWRYQPKTVFLGTSRIHQSIDPTVFQHTRFSPAYNAAVPASTLSQNARNLENYFWLDKNIRYVFIELFIYNFIFPQPEAPQKSLVDLIRSTTALTFSANAIFNSFETLISNRSSAPKNAYIGPLGNWIKPETFNTKDTFNQQSYINNIMSIHKNIPDMIIQPSAIKALNDIVSLCKKHHAKLYMLITPTYPWDDYRLLSLGYWPLLKDWIKMLSQYDDVISFSQYNELLEEKPGQKMTWWNDPIHFNENMGRAMMLSFLGSRQNIPSNLMKYIRADTYTAVIDERTKGLNAWVVKNTLFTTAFTHAKSLSGRVERRPT